jgi:hypothetical protein
MKPTPTDKLNRANTLAAYHADEARIHLVKGNINRAEQEIRISTRWKGVAKRIMKGMTCADIFEANARTASEDGTPYPHC